MSDAMRLPPRGRSAGAAQDDVHDDTQDVIATVLRELYLLISRYDLQMGAQKWWDDARIIVDMSPFRQASAPEQRTEYMLMMMQRAGDSASREDMDVRLATQWHDLMLESNRFCLKHLHLNKDDSEDRKLAATLASQCPSFLHMFTSIVPFRNSNVVPWGALLSKSEFWLDMPLCGDMKLHRIHLLNLFDRKHWATRFSHMYESEECTGDAYDTMKMETTLKAEFQQDVNPLQLRALNMAPFLQAHLSEMDILPDVLNRWWFEDVPIFDQEVFGFSDYTGDSLCVGDALTCDCVSVSSYEGSDGEGLLLGFVRYPHESPTEVPHMFCVRKINYMFYLAVLKGVISDIILPDGQSRTQEMRDVMVSTHQFLNFLDPANDRVYLYLWCELLEHVTYREERKFSELAEDEDDDEDKDEDDDEDDDDDDDDDEDDDDEDDEMEEADEADLAKDQAAREQRDRTQCESDDDEAQTRWAAGALAL